MNRQDFRTLQRLRASLKPDIPPPFFLIVNPVVIREQSPEGTPVIRGNRFHDGPVPEIVHHRDRRLFGFVRNQFRHAEVIDVGSDRHPFGFAARTAEDLRDHIRIRFPPSESVIFLAHDIGISIIFLAVDVIEHLIEECIAALIAGKPVVFRRLLCGAEPDQRTDERHPDLHLRQHVRGSSEPFPVVIFSISQKTAGIAPDLVGGLRNQHGTCLDQIHFPDQVQGILLPSGAGQSGGVNRGHDLHLAADYPLDIKEDQNPDKDDDHCHDSENQSLPPFPPESAPEMAKRFHQLPPLLFSM